MSITENWFVSALIAMFCYAGMALILKHLSESMSVPLILLYLFGLTTLLFGFYSAATVPDFSISSSALILLIAASICAFSGNYFDLQALSTAPNAGYAAAVKAGQITVIAIGAYFLFKGQSITLTGGLGIAFVTLGVTLLATQ